MSRLEEIVYLGDLVYAERDYKDVDKMPKLFYADLNEANALCLGIFNKIGYKKGRSDPAVYS